jgi:type IV pilus assembly protein PilO
MADTNPGRLPFPAQLGISVAVCAVLVGAFYFLFYSDMLTQEQTKTRQLKEVTEQVRALEVTAAKLQEFQREVAVLEQKLETLKRILPPEKETPDLIRKLQNLAAESSLKITSFNPQAMQPRDFYQEFPINLGVEGSFHNLALFFDRIGRLSRLVNVGNTTINAKSDQTPMSTISVTCVATTFVYKEPTPGAEDKGPAKGKGKGK